MSNFTPPIQFAERFDAVAVDGLLHVLHVLAHFHDVQEQGLEAHVVRENGDVEQVRGHALGFLRQHAQVLARGGGVMPSTFSTAMQ